MNVSLPHKNSNIKYYFLFCLRFKVAAVYLEMVVAKNSTRAIDWSCQNCLLLIRGRSWNVLWIQKNYWSTDIIICNLICFTRKWVEKSIQDKRATSDLWLIMSMKRWQERKDRDRLGWAEEGGLLTVGVVKRRLHTLCVGECVAACPCGLSSELCSGCGAAGLSHGHSGAGCRTEPVLVTM